MTYIPETRKPIIKRPFAKEAELNAYYEKLLDPERTQMLRVYDWAVQDASIVFDNFDTALEIAANNIFVAENKPLCETISDQDFLVLNKEEVIEFIKAAFMSYMEMQRQEVAVSLIENTDEEDYQAKWSVMKRDYEKLSKREFKKKYRSSKSYLNY